MRTFLRLTLSALIGVMIGTFLSYGFGFYDHILWENKLEDIKNELVYQADTLTVDDAIILDNIAECMADTFVHFAIVRECSYNVFTSLRVNMIIC